MSYGNIFQMAKSGSEAFVFNGETAKDWISFVGYHWLIQLLDQSNAGMIRSVY